MKNKFYVTTPIYYGTAKPHLGSLYSTLLADVTARWNKLIGNDVFFLTGTDEHGQKIEQAAAKAQMEPKAFVDSFISEYKQTWHNYHIEYSKFIRTTDPFHIKAVQQWIQELIKKGDIYKSFYEGWYCTPCETFVLEKEAIKKEGEAPLCPSCQRATIAIAEETYFFRLSAYQEKLLDFYKQNPEFIVPKERTKEVVNFVKSGLHDLSISRTTVKWGIPFPSDEKHVAYVWADALNNYITAVGYGQPGREDEFKKWWPADLQVMGKDIVRFHAIYWPAFLMASGLPLPKQLLVHGWIKINQQKMSKSLGNVVDPMHLLEKYGADPVRYYLLRQMAITHDGEFSLGDLEQHISSDLANDLGNLLRRMVTLAYKNDLAIVPKIDTWSEKARDLRDASWNVIADFQADMEDCQFHMALARLWKFINQVNAYFHEQEPWKIAKTDKATFAEVMSATAHSLRVIAYLLWPVMPKKMEELLSRLGITLDLHNNTIQELELGRWRHAFTLHQGEPLFIKPEPSLKQEQADKGMKQEKDKGTDYISIDDVAKVQLRVGTIEQCEEIPKSKKLYKLQVDFGELGFKQVLSGIKDYFTPEQLIGSQAVFVFNLKPRKMMGLESHGMILTAQDGQNFSIVSPTKKIENGTQLK